MNIEYFINYLKELISKCDSEIIIVDEPAFLIDDNIYEPKALTVLTYKMETFTVKELVDEFNKYETVYLYTIFRTPSSNCFIVRYVGENKLENFN